MLAVVNTFFEWLKESSASPWFYLIIFAVAVFDSVLPIVPSETLVIIGGVSAGSGSLSIALVIACAASGAFIGDNLSYLIGREASDWVIKRRTRTERGAKQMANIAHAVMRGYPSTTKMVYRLGGSGCKCLVALRIIAWIHRWKVFCR